MGERQNQVNALWYLKCSIKTFNISAQLFFGSALESSAIHDPLWPVTGAAPAITSYDFHNIPPTTMYFYIHFHNCYPLLKVLSGQLSKLSGR